MTLQSILRQAEGYRARRRKEDLERGARKAGNSTAQAIERGVPDVLTDPQLGQPHEEDPPDELPAAESRVYKRTIEVELKGVLWSIDLELAADRLIIDWLTVSDRGADSSGRRRIGVQLSMLHPFMERFSGPDANDIEPLLRVAAALGLAETAARDSGVRFAGTITRNVNALLKDAFSEP